MKDPNIAAEFSALQAELDSPTDMLMHDSASENCLAREARAKRRRDVADAFNEKIREIRRSSEGFDNFLLLLTATQLQEAVDPDPIVVINISGYRCDAFLVTSDNPIKTLELPGLSLDQVTRWTQDLHLASSS